MERNRALRKEGGGGGEEGGRRAVQPNFTESINTASTLCSASAYPGGGGEGWGGGR